jgi:hypothetical protein
MRIRFSAFIVAMSLPLSAAAQPPTTDSLTGKLKSGDTVYLLDSASREITGVFGKMSDSTLTLMVNGELQNYSLSDIRQITRRGGDSLWNGFLIGAVIGGVAGGASTGHAGVGVAGGIIYGGIGALIDAVIDGRVVVYRASERKSVAIVPFFSGDRRGVQVALKF